MLHRRFLTSIAHVHRLSIILLCVLLGFAQQAYSAAEISAFTTSDRSFFAQQRAAIDSLARLNLGREIKGTKDNDLAILQALLKRKLVRPDQEKMLQAMGVILGDLYRREHNLRWVVYSDDKGRSRALQWASSEQVLFPVTMLSRRVKAGIDVDINALYAKGEAVIKTMIANENRRRLLNG